MPISLDSECKLILYADDSAIPGRRKHFQIEGHQNANRKLKVEVEI